MSALRTGSSTALGAFVVCAAILAGCNGSSDPATIRLVRVSEPAGFRFRHELPGGRLDNLPKAAMGGIAVLDFDGDGLLDVYCLNGGWHDSLANAERPEQVPTNRLFRNLGNLRFEDVTQAAGVGDTGFAMGACIGDYDNDGHVDLFVCNYGRSVLYRNTGSGSFEDVTDTAGIPEGFHVGAAFLDYDRDGHLDLFVSQYVDPDKLMVSMAAHAQAGVLPPQAYRPQPDFLLRGKGDGTFEDVSKAAGVEVPGRGMSVLATDIDVDGFVDVLVANDGQANFAYMNQGDGTFHEKAALLGVALGLDGSERASMGITAADLNGDGWLDYLIPDTRGGTVYAGRGKGSFSERAGDWALAGPVERLVGWTDVAIDADNDGRLDVYKSHGHLNVLEAQPSQLFVNRGEMGFARAVADSAGEVRAVARGAVAADLDNDGLEDIVLQELDGLAVVLQNRTTGAGHWVRFRLVGTRSNRMALGARVVVRVGERTFVREVSGSTGYVSAGETRVHVGLGGADAVDSVEVRWPSGAVQRFGAFDGDQEHVLTEE